VPFLVDLFRADWTQVTFVVGDELFEIDHLDDLSEQLQDLGRHEAVALVRAAAWWDPAGGGAWNADRFRFRDCLPPAASAATT
jgi:hypothetical protein